MDLKILLIFCTFILFACYSTELKQHDENIRLYHIMINEAANHIVCFEFKEAMKMYKMAFQYKSEPFAIDIYNKMHVAIYIEDFETMLECAKRLVREKGLSLVAFEEAEGYRNFSEQTEYWEKFRDWYPEGRETFLNSSNQEHIALFKQILEDDQKFRRHPERYTTYMAQNDSMDQVNILKIKDYIQEFGYPNENRIGVYETTFRHGLVGKRVFRDFLNIVFRHYYGNFEKFDFDLSDDLFHAVEQGHLHPKIFKQYMMQASRFKPEYEDLIPGRSHEASVVHLINGEPYITTIDKELLEHSDSLRRELYLSDSKTLFSISTFNILNENLPFNLFFVDGVSIFNFSDPEQKDMFIDVIQLTPLNDGKEYIHCN